MIWEILKDVRRAAARDVIMGRYNPTTSNDLFLARLKQTQGSGNIITYHFSTASGEKVAMGGLEVGEDGTVGGV